MPAIKRTHAGGYRLRMISVDPGLVGTGAVHWVSGVPLASAVFAPPQWVERTFVKPGEDTVVARARYLAQMIKEMAPGGPFTVVIEMPEFQAGAERQMGWKTGSLQKLTLLVGVMVGYLPETWRIILVPPSGWKGQLPKDVVQRRMTAKYGADKCAALRVKTHAWDALGIGEWAWRQEFMQ